MLKEMVTEPVPEVQDVNPALARRQQVAEAIAQLLYSLNRRETATPLLRLRDVAPEAAKPFFEIGELAVQIASEPDLESTAVMAAADVICSDSTMDLTIFEHPRRVQMHYLHLAQSAVNAYRQTLRFVPVDQHGNDAYCRLLDAIAPIEDLESKGNGR